VPHRLGPEWLQVVLDESEVSLRSVITRKESKNLGFEEKKRRTERLTPKRRDPPVVLSADEMGPIGTRYKYVCPNVCLNVKEVRAQGGEHWLGVSRGLQGLCDAGRSSAPTGLARFTSGRRGIGSRLSNGDQRELEEDLPTGGIGPIRRPLRDRLENYT